MTFFLLSQDAVVQFLTFYGRTDDGTDVQTCCFELRNSLRRPLTHSAPSRSPQPIATPQIMCVEMSTHAFTQHMLAAVQRTSSYTHVSRCDASAIDNRIEFSQLYARNIRIVCAIMMI